MIVSRKLWLPVLAVVVVTAAVLLWWHPWSQRAEAIQGTLLTTFPAVDTAALEPAQVRVVEQLREQFQAQNPGTSYAEGTKESWCADFVSWIMRAAGQPLENPNSGSWRIPGVATLQDYYQGVGRFQPVGYQPRVGDVVLYNDASPFHQHTNIVVANDTEMVTTVGGNERGGVRVHRFTLADDPGVVGFGLL